MNFVVDAIRFIFDPGNEVLGKLLAHMGYTALAVGIAAVIALPLGVWLGHTARRGGVVAVLGALRALPSLGLLTWLTLAMSLGVRLPIVPATIVLALLAIPPMLAATVSGIQSVPREVVDGARAVGYSPRQVARFVELPLAAPGPSWPTSACPASAAFLSMASPSATTRRCWRARWSSPRSRWSSTSRSPRCKRPFVRKEVSRCLASSPSAPSWPR